ncbi:GNAT family N-acetyltransferase [Sphingomonas sp.]|uniref:GNAT family N-acetyltransferase n=1 Tax=Sphingomonas sp. TaxID=28214 RepID=UPI003CC6D64A
MFARTPRLTLRPGWPEDAPALTAAIAHEEVAFRLAKLPWPYTLDHAASWLRQTPDEGTHALLVFAHDRGTRADGAPELIGGAGLHPAAGARGEELEIGYWLTPAAWGRGYATEAAGAVVDMARYALGRKRLVSGHFADNPASGRVLRKLGFAQTGVEQRDCLARGEQVKCLTFERAL